MRFAILLPILLCSAIIYLRGQSITLLLTNGKIWTENPEQKEAEAVGISGNRIIAVGATSDILKLRQQDTRVVDLDGRGIVTKRLYLCDCAEKPC